jgi:hypothetical protein
MDPLIQSPYPGIYSNKTLAPLGPFIRNAVEHRLRNLTSLGLQHKERLSFLRLSHSSQATTAAMKVCRQPRSSRVMLIKQLS